MDFSRSGRRASTFATCIAAAGEYGLTTQGARDIVDHQVTVIGEGWEAAADTAELTQVDRRSLFGRQVLNPYAFSD